MGPLRVLWTTVGELRRRPREWSILRSGYGFPSFGYEVVGRMVPGAVIGG